MPLIKKKSGVIFYDVCGQGEPLVALRGLGRSISHWLGYEKELAQHFKVITIDLRGVGKTTIKPDWSMSIFDQAADIAEVLRTLHIDRAHILGVSLGGMVALAMGLRYPQLCSSLIVINTSIAGQLTLRLRPEAIFAIAKGVAKPESLHKRLVDILVGPECAAETRADIAARYEAIAESEGLYRQTILKQLLAASRFHVKHKLKEMHVPTLVLYGTEDRMVPNINSRKLVRYLPSSRLVPIIGAGHELASDKPKELTQEITSWVRTLQTFSATA